MGVRSLRNVKLQELLAVVTVSSGYPYSCLWINDRKVNADLITLESFCLITITFRFVYQFHLRCMLSTDAEDFNGWLIAPFPHKHSVHHFI